ncbi:cation diffusion facilitator family transporter [Aquisalimonas lutea]|uniref:cation diffusion facilitator family transporter n=1 Tax=Aquisalimonas lutea TaxID=1327750 RepID=UPI0025B36F4E|nr:cation diffusion facilitator family transporter [Aquisalimonas lutea]MDN3519095.1 cation diffusion facilitator family transporter [Aquisalimonas lutea]
MTQAHSGREYGGHSHEHHSHHQHSGGRALVTGLVLTATFAVVEIIAGWLSGSLALIGDAGHMITDSMALGLGALAYRLSQQPPTKRHSFGLQRAEVIGALVNAGFMLVVVAWIGYEAVQRFIEPVPVQGETVLVVGAIGLALNFIVLKVLHGGEQNLNTRGAILHVLGDLLGSVAALASGVVIALTGWTPIDPILSLLISALILISTSRLLRDAVHVVMEGVPPHVDLDEVRERMARVEGIDGVHDLHIWIIASGSYAIAAHVRTRRLAEWPEQLDKMKRLLREDFGIEHVTLQPELPYDVATIPVVAGHQRRGQSGNTG